MTALSINLNKVSLLRNSREGNYPSVLKHAQLCIDNGADGITVHPRPDQRHIRPSDVRELSELVKPLADIEFNIEGNPFAPAVADYPGFISLVEQTQRIIKCPADPFTLPFTQKETQIELGRTIQTIAFIQAGAFKRQVID